MKITDMFKDSVELKIDVESLDGRPFKFHYRPNLLTNQFRVAAAVSLDVALQTMAEGLICEWDLHDDEGNPVPITYETLQSLPAATTARMMRAMENYSLDAGNSSSLSDGNGRGAQGA